MQNIRVIADVGSNWRVSGETDAEALERAKRMIKRAAGAGAWGVKFQLFKATGPNRLNMKEDKRLKPYELPVEWLPELRRTAEEHRVEFMVTPFYVDAVEEIAPHVNYFKVASHDMTYIPLLEEVARVMQRDEKSLFMSINGGYKFEELEAAIAPFKKLIRSREVEVTVFYCTGGYPTPVGQAELSKIMDLVANTMMLTNPVIINVGFSVHIPPSHMHIPASTVLYGVDTFELHFIDSDMKGVESEHSYSPKELRAFINMLGDFRASMSCSCAITVGNAFAIDAYRRNPIDWKRPFKRDIPGTEEVQE